MQRTSCEVYEKVNINCWDQRIITVNVHMEFDEGNVEMAWIDLLLSSPLIGEDFLYLHLSMAAISIRYGTHLYANR